MSSTNLDKIIYDEINHVHRLEGFIIDGKAHSFELKTAGTGAGGSGQVLHKTLLVAQAVKADLIKYGEYSADTDYYVTLTPVAEAAVAAEPRRAPRSRQVGAGPFPLEILPYQCDESKITVDTSVMPSYNEPTISYVLQLIQQAIASSGVINNHISYLQSLNLADVVVIFDRMTAAHKVNSTHPDFPAMLLEAFSKCTPENIHNGKFRNILLIHHLRENQYAHNGADSAAMLKLFRMVGSKFYHLEMIHSLLHIYDCLYMYEKRRYHFTSQFDLLGTMFTTFVPDLHQRQCLFRLLNEKAGSFLDADPLGYMLPYRISAAALPSKDRQYGYDCKPLMRKYAEQICKPQIYNDHVDDHTDKLPNT